ncbi:phosphocholine-specific phospholipase C [Jatrophihabitans sp. YIM 134969]
MPNVDRRRFLQLAGGASALSLLPTSIARASSLPADRRHGTIDDVDHVVVLMQENRSFDHYFGTLRGVRGYGDPHPAVLPNGRSVWHQADGDTDVLPFRPDLDDLGLAFIQDLAHGWSDTHAAWNNGNYDGWIGAKSTTTMAHLQRSDMPFHHALADAFTVCDAYHCSFMGSTDPNRYHLWTGWTGNDGRGGGPVIGNDEAGYDWTTYPERLEAAGVSWKIYQDIGTGLDADGSWGWTTDPYIGNYGDNSLLYFDRYRNADPGSALYEKARTGTNAAQGDDLFRVLRRDVVSGKLPQVSWIAAPEAFTEHPNWPANYGAWYIAKVLDALTANPDVWARTVFLVTYDENDGFFDHVVPPYPSTPSLPGASTVSTAIEEYRGSQGVRAPYGLGQRVPMIAISPWSTGGWVCSETFDHTSVLRFTEKRFGVAESNISAWRRTVCGDLTSAFDFAKTTTSVPTLPRTGAYKPTDHERHPDYVPTPPADPSLPRQEPGTRPSRPLGYRVDARATVTPGRVDVALRNDGRIGAHFQARVQQPAAVPPSSYTLGAGRSLAAHWSAPGAYDLAIHGPNGFYRRWAGTSTAAEPEVTLDVVGGVLVLAVANPGTRPLTATVADAYRPRRPTTLTVPPGRSTTHRLPISDTAGWYDFTVTTPAKSGAPVSTRQLAGRIETGRPSTSDPQLGR